MGAENNTKGGVKNDDRRRNEIISCACRCGKKLEKYIYHYNKYTNNWQRKERKFIHGHNGKFLVRDQEFRDKIRKSVKKWHDTVGHSKATIEKIRQTQLRKRDYYARNKIGIKNPMFSKHISIWHKKRIKELIGGKNHWNWKGGAGYERGNDWEVQRKLCYKRDKYKCQDCGIYRSKAILTAHHLDPYIESKNNNLDNLITLCRPCHGRRHGRGHSKN